MNSKVKKRAIGGGPRAQATQQTASQPAAATKKKVLYDHGLSLRVDVALFQQINNMIKQSHLSGDFTYESISDLLRKTIQDLMDSGDLRVSPYFNGKKRRRTIDTTAEQAEFWASLPEKHKSSIVDRALRERLGLM